MLYLKVENPHQGAHYLGRGLLGALDKQSRVLWLVPGGSNVDIVVEVLSSLSHANLNNLTLALVDERYGKVGHKDSNYYKLQQAGIDHFKVNFEAVLTNQNLGFDECVRNYQSRLQQMFNESDEIIGQFGIGSDGHTAGILPNSEACVIDNRLVIGYQAADFQRITLSFTAIKMVNQAYIFAFGEDKAPTLSLLHDIDQPLVDQPAQIFRQYIPKSYIINNMIGDPK